MDDYNGVGADGSDCGDERGAVVPGREVQAVARGGLDGYVAFAGVGGYEYEGESSI